MEKMELSEALKANASVLEGLLPLATNETKGLASMNMCIAYVGEGPLFALSLRN